MNEFVHTIFIGVISAKGINSKALTGYGEILANKAPSQISGKSQKRNLLCLIGFHKWKKSGGLNIYSSNVRERYFICTRCGKKKTVYEAKKE